MSDVKRIIIDPRSRINYAAYYIQGGASVYGWDRIVFRPITISSVHDLQEYYTGCTLEIEFEDGHKAHVFIDSHDSNKILEDFYLWADVYAKINVRPEDVDREKLLVIGPSFGIQLWNPIKTIWLGMRNYLKCKSIAGFNISIKTFLLDYAYTFVRRERIQIYETSDGEENRDSVFALSTLWYDQQTYSTTNRFRGAFARACKVKYPQFEGGFFYIPSADVVAQFPQYQEYLQEYKDMLITKRIGMREYLRKTKKSAIVFNTPSVLGCHGWKCGEYLAMGKAIISMPLNNVMPGDFQDGVHYLGAKSEEEIARAVERLRNDEDLRQSLKRNARDYYETYLSPVAVIRRIVSKCR